MTKIKFGGSFSEFLVTLSLKIIKHEYKYSMFIFKIILSIYFELNAK